MMPKHPLHIDRIAYSIPADFKYVPNVEYIEGFGSARSILISRLLMPYRKTDAVRYIDDRVRFSGYPATRGQKRKWKGREGLLLFLQVEAQKQATGSKYAAAVRAVKKANPELWGRGDADGKSLRVRFYAAKREFERLLQEFQARSVQI
jgi:hypothetical protein